jgi:hypothetical protein
MFAGQVPNNFFFAKLQKALCFDALIETRGLFTSPRVDNTTPYTSMNKMALPVKSNNDISGEAIN